MAQITIEIAGKGFSHYFYYPDHSCKRKDGGMKMLLEKLKEEDEPYELKVRYSP